MIRKTILKTMLNYLIDNNYVIYGLCTTTAGFIGYLVIKSYFYSTIIETPHTPQTFNFTPEQFLSINSFLDQGGVLNKETNDRLDQDLQTIMGEDDYNNFQDDLQAINNEFSQELLRVFAEEFSRL
ncbi:MAG: hypothetical protein E6K49_06295 [Gammaproteobacteria bacterium]|nr:MAG: hypothetical protein E6K49_06295 [Gammaproteobacteria bacterium]